MTMNNIIHNKIILRKEVLKEYVLTWVLDENYLDIKIKYKLNMYIRIDTNVMTDSIYMIVCNKKYEKYKNANRSR